MKERERERELREKRRLRFCLGIADVAHRSIHPSSIQTAACISISAELGVIDAERFIALFTGAMATRSPQMPRNHPFVRSADSITRPKGEAEKGNKDRRERHVSASSSRALQTSSSSEGIFGPSVSARAVRRTSCIPADTRRHIYREIAEKTWRK